jgi:primosomal protein N' (replication factor Y)
LAAGLEPVGVGTQQIEGSVRRLFSQARIARLDGDIPRLKADAIRRLLCSGELDILVGTQMAFQGHSLPQVGYVGLVHADAGLHLPDFQAGERTYHLLLDAVAMARPSEAGGHVVLQTYLPTHHVIESVSRQIPAIFYNQELAFRRSLGYPPFSHLISLRVTGMHEDRVRRAAEDWGERLRSTVQRKFGRPRHSRPHNAPICPEQGTADMLVMGPIPASVTQVRGRYRWQLLVKSASEDAAREVVRETLDALEDPGPRTGLKYEVDVDPISM